MSKIMAIDINDAIVSITKIKGEDYICLTDMAKSKGGDSRAADVIKNWIRTRTTIEFLGTRETMYNPNFKVVEFDHFKMEAGLPTFVLSPKQWAEKTGAIGIISKSGRYGGTYAHRDIAFEFGAAISPTFKLYLIKEYQRFKEILLPLVVCTKTVCVHGLSGSTEGASVRATHGRDFMSYLNSLHFRNPK